MTRRVKDKPQTTSREQQEHLAVDGVVDYGSTIQYTLYQENGDAQKAFPQCFSLEE